jgi:hypothetical protein
MRSKRNHWFRSLIAGVPRPLRILDVGGTQTVWESLGFVNQPEIEITLLNVKLSHSSYSNVISVVGDARDMREYRDQEFDVVYSNSVIEHVGGQLDTRRMANEIRRVGKRYFVQTPYRYFPIEPHFLFPMYQFLPCFIQVSLVQRFNLGWKPRQPDRAQAEAAVRSIHLLSKTEMHSLFPDATFADEKIIGFPKSLLAFKI